MDTAKEQIIKHGQRKFKINCRCGVLAKLCKVTIGEGTAKIVFVCQDRISGCRVFQSLEDWLASNGEHIQTIWEPLHRPTQYESPKYDPHEGYFTLRLFMSGTPMEVYGFFIPWGYLMECIQHYDWCHAYNMNMEVLEKWLASHGVVGVVRFHCRLYASTAGTCPLDGNATLMEVCWESGRRKVLDVYVEVFDDSAIENAVLYGRHINLRCITTAATFIEKHGAHSDATWGIFSVNGQRRRLLKTQWQLSPIQAIQPA